MGIQFESTGLHWNYLLALERDVERLSRYVEFDPRNYGCFSLEIARILMAAGAETDVICRQMCVAISPGSRPLNIRQYRDEIRKVWPDLPNYKVTIDRFGLTLRPWDEWNNNDGIPIWWTAYNKIKHRRDSEYHRASLHNALNAIAGLFVMVLHLYNERARAGRLLPPAQLLRVGSAHFLGETHHGYEIGVNYDVSLPSLNLST